MLAFRKRAWGWCPSDSLRRLGADCDTRRGAAGSRLFAGNARFYEIGSAAALRRPSAISPSVGDYGQTGASTAFVSMLIVTPPCVSL